MDFGIFDHLDRYDIPLRDFYAERLKLVELYDAAGFYSYHLAEHHATPLGMAPSPSVFLAAVAERTKRLRFGPMIYALPLYHPLRIIEEICMLDQMSGGRFDMGFGRGASAHELRIYGENPDEAQAVYTEMLEIVLKGLTHNELTHHSDRWHFDKVPMMLEPLQKPYPPIWYGVHGTESAERAARRGLNVISLDAPDETRIQFDQFRKTWRECNGDAPTPKLGIGRFIVVGESDEEAMRMARRAYPLWHDSFNWLFRRNNTTPRLQRPFDYDTTIKVGQGVGGSPETVIKALQSQVEETGSNYIVGQFAFGDLTLEECRRSIGLFVDKVMPALRKVGAKAPVT